MITTRYGLTTAVLTCGAALLAGPQVHASSIAKIDLDVDFLDPTTGSELTAVVPGQRVTVSVEVESSTNGLAMFGVEANNGDSDNFTFEPFDNTSGATPFPDIAPRDDNDFNNTPASGSSFPFTFDRFTVNNRALSTSTNANLSTGLRLNEAIPERIQDSASQFASNFKGTIDMTADGDGTIGKGQTEILNFDIFVNDDATIGSSLDLNLEAKDEIFDTSATKPDNPDPTNIPDDLWSRLTENLNNDPNSANPAISMLPSESDNAFSFVYAEVVPLDPDAFKDPGAISLYAYDSVSITGNSISVVPSPTAALGGLMLLGGLALRRRRRVA